MEDPRPGGRSPGLRVRESGPEDRDFVLRLVPELLAFGPPPPWRDAPAMERVDRDVIGAALDGRVPGTRVLVAEDGERRRLGFIHVSEEDDYYGGACGHIGDIVVAPEARGQGVGRALLAAAEDWARARGYRLITLNVFLDNAGARRTYERAGYRPETIRHVKPLV
ncbi:MAG TPA: GNAT family N-acetyltransferase [Vicinamibacteria bacterium]|nr:GNAT family N-acetyltransferase [Vicinamibacteria bacterium]